MPDGLLQTEKNRFFKGNLFGTVLSHVATEGCSSTGITAISDPSMQYKHKTPASQSVRLVEI